MMTFCLIKLEPMLHNSLYIPVKETFQRLPTIDVPIGGLMLGSKHPIRIQSMTNTNTLNIQATIEQTIRMVNAGCELVRITAQGIKEAETLAEIKKGLRLRGYDVPLIADIHFNPKAAEVAARLVEKVRINPGNYTERNSEQAVYSESATAVAKERILKNIKPLIAVCKQYGTALRIGSNQGSLSQRILSGFGDTPEGMVEAALEFVEICEVLGFYNLVLSMKSSNPHSMMLANRLLAQKLLIRGRVYPIHLGVTEAGEGEDGRIKSASGIGAMLAEGIGDTLRVSLTEDPEKELPVAKALVRQAEKFEAAQPLKRTYLTEMEPPDRSKSLIINSVGGQHKPLVIGRGTEDPKPDIDTANELPFEAFNLLAEEINTNILDRLSNAHNLVIVLSTQHARGSQALKTALIQLSEAGIRWPIVLKKTTKELDEETFLVETAAELGPLFQEGYGNAIWLQNPRMDDQALVSASYALLQAARARISRAEFISCPSCGRTQYNIQEAVQSIRSRTSHLTGITIGVMGCIVNGPGEMAGADYGYVGSGRGVVTLFKRKEAVKKNIPEESAVDELIDLIKAHGDWKEPGTPGKK